MRMIPRRVLAAAQLGACCYALFLACGPSGSNVSIDERAGEASRPAVERKVQPRLSLERIYRPIEPAECAPKRLLCEPKVSAAPNPPHISSSSVSSLGETTDDRPASRRQALRRLASSPGGIEETVMILEELLEQSPRDALLLSDLAAAYFVRAQRTDRPSDLARALDLAERAALADPRAPGARFNQALTREALGLRLSAVSAWQDYLAEDSESGWSDEARERLRDSSPPKDSLPQEEARRAFSAAAQSGDLEAALREVDRSRLTARTFVEEEALPSWAEDLAEGKEGAARRHLDVARAIAEELASASGDHLLVETVAAIDESAGDPHRLGHLVHGHRTYGRAAESYDAFALEDAARDYLEASAALHRGGSPFEVWAEVGKALGFYHESELEEAMAILNEIRELAGERRYRSLLARVNWLIATCYSIEPRPMESLIFHRAALRDFELAGEHENVASMHARLAETFLNMGETELAWRHRYQALHGLADSPLAKKRFYVLLEAADAAFELDLTQAALTIQEEALRVARESGSEFFVAEGLRKRAEFSLRAGNPQQALDDLQDASEISDELLDENVQSAVKARIEEIEAQLWLTQEPERAIGHLTEALARLPMSAYHRYRAKLLLERARVYIRAELAELAERDLKESIDALETEWRQVLDVRRPGEYEELWPSYFAHRQETFDLMIRLLIDEGRDEDAFSYAERARARELLDLIADSAPSEGLEQPWIADSNEPLSEREVRAGLPPGTVLVEYAQLEDRLLIWVLRPSSLKVYVRAAGRQRLSDLVDQILSQTSREGSEIDIHEPLAELYSILIAPFASELAGGEDLVFIPDESIHNVPFAALHGRGMDRFLIEDHSMAFAPSAKLYLHTLDRDRDLRQGTRPSILLVGNPAFSTDLFENLERLPDAISEIQQIADLYPESRLLTDEAATKSRFLEEIDRYDVVHFAGHAVAVPQAPFRSSLILAPTEDDKGVLYAFELHEHHLFRTRLVVLSACSTAGGYPIGSVGASGLVRPLLGAGVPAVVGSLWDVEDVAAARLLSRFHQRFRAGESVASALRDAQLDLLYGSNYALRSVLSWAPFQVIGTASLENTMEKRSEQ